MRRHPSGLDLRCELRPAPLGGIVATCLDLGVEVVGTTDREARATLRVRAMEALEASWDDDSRDAPRPVPHAGRRWLAARFARRGYLERFSPAEVEALEDRVDVRASEQAEKEEGAPAPWGQVKANLGL